jgi:hypothetical protein
LAIPPTGPRIAIVSEESKRIARQWNREIEAEIRGLAVRGTEDGPWKLVLWLAFGALWIGLVMVMLFGLKLLQW